MLPENLYVRMRQFAVGVLVDLYEIDLTAIGGGKYRFTNNVFEERVPIKFGGYDFIPMPITMDDVEIDAQGAPAQPSFKIATAGGPVNALLEAYDNLRGATITRYNTLAEFLDLMPDPANPGEVTDNPDADAASIFNLEMYVVDQKKAGDPTGAELQLVAPTDQQGVMLPLRIVRKRWCSNDYRVPDSSEPDGFFYFEPVDGGCPYTGTAYFDENDQPTTADNDRCSKQVSGCVCRFGKAAALPYGALPGIRSVEEAST